MEVKQCLIPKPTIDSAHSIISEIKFLEFSPGFLKNLFENISAIFSTDAQNSLKARATNKAASSDVNLVIKQVLPLVPLKKQWRCYAYAAQQKYLSNEIESALLYLRQVDESTTKTQYLFLKAVVLKDSNELIESYEIFKNICSKKRPGNRFFDFSKDIMPKILQDMISRPDLTNEDLKFLAENILVKQTFLQESKYNCIDALYYLFRCYLYGFGVEKNRRKAFLYLATAAEKGHAEAQYLLAVCYESGIFVGKNPAEAVRLLRLATDQGDACAQYDLAECFYKGKGVDKDTAEAVRLYRLAAKQGHRIAQNNLAVCLCTGKGADKDPVEAVSLFRLAADQGYLEALSNLAVCLYRGMGADKDIAEARRLFQLAVDQGYAKANDILKKLEGE